MCTATLYRNRSLMLRSTPHIIRQVVEMGIAKGWQESDASGDFRMGHLDDKIDKTQIKDKR